MNAYQQITYHFIMTLELAIDIVATILGFISIFLLVRLNRNLGGKMNTAVRLFIGGIVFMVLAFAWTMVFGHVGVELTVGGMGAMEGMEGMGAGGMQADGDRYVDAHHILMAIGMIFLILSSRKFSSLVNNG